DAQPRTLEVALDFLEPGRRYTAQVYRDGDHADYRDSREDIVIEAREVTSTETLTLRLAQDAGMDPPAAANPSSVVNCIVYARDDVHRDVPLGTLGELLARDRDSFAWIGLYEPDDGVLERLQEQFGLHDLAIEDAHKAH